MITYIDSGVLIAAAIGNEKVSCQALKILSDGSRKFVGSEFLKLEVLPKAIYNKKTREIDFYNCYFKSLYSYHPGIDNLIEEAYNEACSAGLSIQDAIHIIAAIKMEAEEFFTTEKASKSIHRTKRIKVISIKN